MRGSEWRVKDEGYVETRGRESKLTEFQVILKVAKAMSKFRKNIRCGVW